jgi:aryl-alcohol dehydrogenase-like predicted oxidoreductase
MMKQRKIGGSEVLSSVFGVGCNKLLDPANPDMVKTANDALDLGMNQFDCADAYGGGLAEEFLGQVVQSRRNEAVIVSKFGVVSSTDAQTRMLDTSPSYVRQACERSLQRLRTDHIDLYYQHRMNPSVPIEDTVGAMAELVVAGKIRAIGLCNTTPDFIRRAHAVYPLAAVQMEYSLMAREVEAEILPLCRELGITFVAYGPLTYAFLTGAVRSKADLPQGDMFRHRQSRFEDDNIGHNIQMLETLTAIGAEVGATPTQVALAWCLYRPFDVLPIPGSTKPHHLHENAAAAAVALNADHVAELDNAFAYGAAKGDGAGALTPAN